MLAPPRAPSLYREYRAEPGSTFVTRRSMSYNGRDEDVIDRLRARGLRPACHMTPLADAPLELSGLVTERLTRYDARELASGLQVWV
jgi:hypothetical protein